MKKKLFAVVMTLFVMSVTAASAAPTQTYYYIAPGLGQPYCYDMHLGFKYEAEKFNVEIIQQGADDCEDAFGVAGVPFEPAQARLLAATERDAGPFTGKFKRQEIHRAGILPVDHGSSLEMRHFVANPTDFDVFFPDAQYNPAP